MKVSFFPKQLSKEKTTVILGGFESIHNGHLELIKEAKKNKLPIAIMIIDDCSYFSKSKNIYLPLELRLYQLALLNVNYALVLKMTQQLMFSEGFQIFKKIETATNGSYFVSGKDFAMGHNRQLKARDIKKNKIVEIKKFNNKKISTSLLKELVEIGEIELIQKLSPFPFMMSLEKKLTTIRMTSNQVMPHSGIYAISLIKDDFEYLALLHITFDQKIEIKILNDETNKVLNKPTKFFIKLHKLIRKIISSGDDTISEQDIFLSSKTLKNIY